ncbi:nitroreductase family protein [Kosakonia sp. S58]|nr:MULTISPECIES: nitroreductase family protein [unclassified Kosakonia]MBK0081148.1 nitroreductase family protein [Kosakonia sp. S57]MBK0088045.1 nitroreductase family protein [Kosakonia sp. S58]
MDPFQQILKSTIARTEVTPPAVAPQALLETVFNIQTLVPPVEMFLALAKARRSIYALGKDLPVSHEEAIATIKEAIRQAPSAFHSQTLRALILLDHEHERFWELVRAQMRNVIPAESFHATADKLDGFSAAAGTVLFFEDQEVVSHLQRQYVAYAEHFPVWSEQSSGIAQYAVWLALADKQIGANLQHYHLLIDADVRATWNIPESWTLRAEMNFGAILAPAEEKTFIDDEKRFIVAR